MIDNGQLEHLARRLGDEEARRIDPEATARAVLRRLREAPRPGRWWRRPAVLRVAAAAVILLAGAVGLERVLSRGAGPDPSYPILVELADLGADDLAEVLDSLVFEAPVSELVSGGLGALSEAQLREILAVMDGD